MSFKNKMMLLAIFGILIGFVAKTEAAKRFTVGFEDYKLGNIDKVYDINQLQRDLEKLQAAQIEASANVSQ